MEIAFDHRAPGEHIMNARVALTTVRRAGRLTPADYEALHRDDDPPGLLPEHGHISVDLLRARRLQVLALDLAADEAVTVVGLCRAEDPRVRQVALVTAGEAMGAAGDIAERDALAWAVVGGLFDPVDDVVRTATGAITAEFLERHLVPAAVALDSFPRLQHEGGVRLRATVAAITRRWVVQRPELADDAKIKAMLMDADCDRSWTVRVARQCY